MEIKESVSAFLEKLKKADFPAFENQTMLQIIKCCDPATKSTYFSDAPECSGFDDGWKEVAIKLISYIISVSNNSPFNTIYGIRGMQYDTSVGCLLDGNKTLWQDILDLFVKSINPDIDPEFMNEFYKNTTTPEFIQFTCMQSEQLAGYPHLCFEIIRKYLPEKYDDYYNEWKKYASSDKLAVFSGGFYFSGYATSDKLKAGLKVSVENALNRQTNYTSDSYCERRSYGVPLLNHDLVTLHERRTTVHEAFDTGLDVCVWLKADVTRQYMPHIGAVPNPHSDNTYPGVWYDDRDPPSSGCVTKDTQIALADHTTAEISSIREGYRILSEENRISITSDELIVNRTIKCLYGINEISPFMSLEHAVMTSTGWKSLDPQSSNAINPHYNVGLLKKGDHVITMDGEIEVSEITVLNAAPGSTFTGYDLHFREGYHSYFANGLLVLLNYPEITLTRIIENLRGMQAADACRFVKLLTDNSGLFREVFGDIPIRQFTQYASAFMKPEQ